MTPDERKEYMRLYNLKNKEKMEEYRLKNKERDKEKRREYRIKNREKRNEYNREYSQTENGKKSMRIGAWKKNGVICEDINKLHDTYINTNNCEWCNNDLGKKKCLEHNHYSGEIRGIVCNSCNMKIRYKDNNYQKCMLSIISYESSPHPH